MKTLKRKKKRKNKNKEPCFFPEKLYKVLKKNENNNIIHWNEDGTIVVIKDSIEFSKKILQKKFKTNNYSSFVRQLNIYGFHKINNIYNSKEDKFINEEFTRDRSINKIREIKRKELADSISDDNNLEENEIEEQKSMIENINKIKDNYKKIDEYKKLVKKGNIHPKFINNILEVLNKMNNERINFYEKTEKELKDLITNNEITLKQLECLSPKNNT